LASAEQFTSCVARFREGDAVNGVALSVVILIAAAVAAMIYFFDHP
jgi:hypothetical protein